MLVLATTMLVLAATMLVLAATMLVLATTMLVLATTMLVLDVFLLTNTTRHGLCMFVLSPSSRYISPASDDVSKAHPDSFALQASLHSSPPKNPGNENPLRSWLASDFLQDDDVDFPRLYEGLASGNSDSEAG
ncbi:hypothetical protein BV898_10518 [Hypsibius exemplaris]|uniref:Uncharacterized protein n=1 Tax=Hypsibius exemplaris TaxID=2072580 RepID=A0A1W0WJE5_HYPEX|nr:hypothetical protein BV898_10518 [Hypsibius exemplaris]